MSTVALLDVNLLVALFDPDHVHHELAHDWFSDQKEVGWATCPVTENGLLRVLTSPAYRSPANRPDDIVARLRAFRKSGGHEFWADAVSLADEKTFSATYLRGHRQVTDVYLLGLARSRGGLLATFDRSIPAAAVKGATKATLQVITAA